ncbi:trefoil factor 2 [Octodon degus]|uniref:Trefoil factor 2 n=1 Tax=Octodon degus TaxID=10160 RepID=A0A6P3EUH2_OCTDE|nr:trefoil factor 2 [Octodon degus]
MRPQSAPLLAVVLVLGLCALVAGEKPSPCQCSRLSPHNRKNCGFPGITSDQCFNLGCCFSSSVIGVPWCFDPLPKQVDQQCVMEVSDRKNCGYPGISPEDCASRHCCFSDTIPQVPWCFFPKSVEGFPSILRAFWVNVEVIQGFAGRFPTLQEEQTPQEAPWVWTAIIKMHQDADC